MRPPIIAVLQPRRIAKGEMISPRVAASKQPAAVEMGAACIADRVHQCPAACNITGEQQWVLPDECDSRRERRQRFQSVSRLSEKTLGAEIPD